VPRWKQAAKNLAAFSRRWSLNAPAVEVLTGILPTAQVDKHWTNDRLDLYGLFVQVPGTATVGRLGAVSIVAQELEVLVHGIDVWLDANVSTFFSVHLFSPLQTYAPTAINTTLQLPWLQPVQPGEPGRLSRAFGMGGERDAGLQSVIVNGIAFTTIGPTFQIWGGLVTRDVNQVWRLQDPPLRLKPFQSMTIQVLAQMSVGRFLNVNWYYSERTFQGDVG